MMLKITPQGIPPRSTVGYKKEKKSKLVAQGEVMGELHREGKSGRNT